MIDYPHSDTRTYEESTSREIRTHTRRVLSALSLPIGLGRYMVRQDGVAPPVYLTWVIYSHLTSLLVTLTHINPDYSWRPLGKPHRMFLLAETENQLTRKDLYISREIVPTTRVPPPCSSCLLV